MYRKTDASAHCDAIEQCDVRLLHGADQMIQSILFTEEISRNWVLPLCSLDHCEDIATGTKRFAPHPFNQDVRNLTSLLKRESRRQRLTDGSMFHFNRVG